jgi:hypothetical protein
LGERALLLKLANGVLRYRMAQGEALANALDYLNEALDKRGLMAFDAENAQDRNAAVSATVRVSFELLDGEQYARYQELAAFPEDVDIPLATLQKLWGATGGMDDFDTEELCQTLCQTLCQHSLLLNFDLVMRTIRLHDVIRSYLQKAVGDALSALHIRLLDAHKLTRWADLPADEPYLWDHLAYHLAAAGRLAELVATVKDLGYLANKTLARTAYAAEADLAFAEQRAPTDVPLRLLKRNFANMGHLLNRCHSYNEIAAVLYSWLVHLHELSDICLTFEQDIPRPYLICWHQLTYLPDPALIRTLSGHTGVVNRCAISPAGNTIVSASDDQTLKRCDAHTGEEKLTLRGHTNGVTACAISPSGDSLVSASSDDTLKVWDARTGACLNTLYVNGPQLYDLARERERLHPGLLGYRGNTGDLRQRYTLRVLLYETDKLAYEKFCRRSGLPAPGPESLFCEQPDAVRVVRDLSTVEELELAVAMSSYLLHLFDAPHHLTLDRLAALTEAHGKQLRAAFMARHGYRPEDSATPYVPVTSDGPQDHEAYYAKEYPST